MGEGELHVGGCHSQGAGEAEPGVQEVGEDVLRSHHDGVSRQFSGLGPRSLLDTYILTTTEVRFRLPCFFMPSALRIAIQLHFFEPRYCLLIARVVRGYADDGRLLGDEMPRPRFFYLPGYSV